MPVCILITRHPITTQLKLQFCAVFFALFNELLEYGCLQPKMQHIYRIYDVQLCCLNVCLCACQSAIFGIGSCVQTKIKYGSFQFKPTRYCGSYLSNRLGTPLILSVKRGYSYSSIRSSFTPSFPQAFLLNCPLKCISTFLFSSLFRLKVLPFNLRLACS